MKTSAFGSTALLFYAKATPIGTDSCSRYENQDDFCILCYTVLSFCVKVTPTGAQEQILAADM
jgi:hypothetical protein